MEWLLVQLTLHVTINLDLISVKEQKSNVWTISPRSMSGSFSTILHEYPGRTLLTFVTSVLRRFWRSFLDNNFPNWILLIPVYLIDNLTP